MKDYQSPNGQFFHHVSHSVKDESGKPVLVKSEKGGRLQRRGHREKKKLRVVCEKCNNGWMSEIENDSKPILTPFLNGDWQNLFPQNAVF